MRREPVRVLIVDDSAVVRGLLTRAIESDPGIVVAGTAMHGATALAWMRKNPVDIAIVDVEMPVMDGIETLQQMQREFPAVPVIMASSLTQSGTATTVRALSLGAAGCIGKPVARNTIESIDSVARELVPLIKGLTAETRNGASSAAATSPTRRLPRPRSLVRPGILVIGASTGGPQALSKVLSGLPADFPLPILIVQHMPPMFTPTLARHLAQDTRRPCREAADGEPIERHHTYVAPGDYHVVVEKAGDRMVTTLNQAPPEHFCRPSVNPLFRSAAQWYGTSVLAVMLTGMGEDGLEGAREVVARRGYLIAQDQASSVVWGMPGAVVREQLAHEVLPLDEIAPAIRSLCRQEVCRV